MGKVLTSVEEMKAQILSALEASESEVLLQKVWELVEERRKMDTIVGYRVDGTPISEFEIVNEIEKSSQEVKEGKFHTTEAARKRFGL